MEKLQITMLTKISEVTNTLRKEMTDVKAGRHDCRAFTTVTRTNSNSCSDTVMRTQVIALHGTRASPWAGSGGYYHYQRPGDVKGDETRTNS
ncbi:hypothetical protein J6590_083285 [Homalodisca vitripennis]|nr:hypothetical protein J6590_083285 [Homalodisca vitripennis]